MFEGVRVEGDVSSVVGGVKELRHVSMAPQHSSNGSNTLSHTRTCKMRGRNNRVKRGRKERKKEEIEKRKQKERKKDENECTRGKENEKRKRIVIIKPI